MGTYDSLLKVCVTTPLDTDGVFGTGQVKVLRDCITAFDKINIAFDQSTSQIGVAISDASDNQLIAVADLCNCGFPSKLDFKLALLDFMQNNFHDVDIDYFFYEIPVEHGDNIYTRRVLNNLMEFIEEMPRYLTPLANAKMYACNNLVWKSHYLEDPCYKGRRKTTSLVKVAAQEETWKRFPWTQQHGMYFPKPADSCDAVGILYGAFKEMFSPNLGKPYLQINRLMSKGRSVKVMKDIIACRVEDIPTEVVKFNPYTATKGFSIVEYNPKMDIQENIQRWVQNFPGTACIVVINPKAEQIVRWESKMERNPDQLYVIFAQRER